MEHHCEGGEGRLEMRVQTKNVMDEVELRTIYFFDSEKHGGIPDLWTPYMRMRRYDAWRIARWSTSRVSPVPLDVTIG